MPDLDRLEFDGIFQATINPAKVSENDFTLPVHQSMYRFWIANWRPDKLPPSSTVDPLAFREALGYLHLVEPNADVSDFKYRVYATCVSEIGVVDMTGKWFSESPIPSWKFYSRQLAAAVALRAPIYSENDADYQVSVLIKWCRLLLPMVDTNGTVDRILVAIVPVNRNHEQAL
jgi:hypothetical protein